MKKRILFYNWIPFDETEGKGGGVTVYVRNLLSCLAEDNRYEIYFLSSGRAYDMNQYRTFIEPTENVFGEKVKSFQVVNSPVLSAANLSFPYPHISNEDVILKSVIGKFIAEYGFDVIHFQNLEGLGIKVLELKEDYPDTKFIYSIHNYYMVCPQVMLWQAGGNSCRENECGECCISCMPKHVHFSKIMFNQFVDARGKGNPELIKLKKTIADYYSQIDSCEYQIGEEDQHWLTEEFKRFRTLNVEYVNRYVDDVLAVSKRVSELIIEKGVDARKVHVSYIGTKAAERAKEESSYSYSGGIFHVCYLGYMREMKGFYFLLDALEAMPETMSRKLSVTIAARKTDSDAEKRISGLDGKYAEIMLYDGYSHNDLPKILRGVNLGIVPPLWEDNLPQVAIEMQAAGIPVLCSNMGGAKEIVNSEGFVFEAGNISDFIYKLQRIMDDRTLVEDYWKNASHLTKMDEHIEDLKKFYEGVKG